MSSLSQHLSKELRELIRSIGQTKSKQDQDNIIMQELSTLRPKLSEKNISPKKLKEMLIRTLYIEMLGHSASFAHIHAINLTQNKNLVLKRIGYLMCTLFLSRQSELLILLVSTITKDLSSTDVHEVVICLTSLGNLINQTIATAVVDLVVKLLEHKTDLVRKKAMLVLHMIKRSTDIAIPDFKDKIKKCLCDVEPSVMSASLNVYYEEIKDNPRKYRDLMSYFVIILRQIFEHKLPKEYDYHRLPAPWTQIQLMKIIELLGKGDLKTSEHCYSSLQQVLKRSYESHNLISFAVTYQCVRTIANIYPNQKLIEEAASCISRFLDTKSTNSMKHMGIQALSQLYKQYPKLLEQYQLTIVDCLESKDETLKRQTLELLAKMTRQDNIVVITRQMLNSLCSSTDVYFRNALVSKITELAQRFSPTHQWYIDTMQILFELGSEYLNEGILNNFIRLVVQNYSQNPAFGLQILGKMRALYQKAPPTDFIAKVVVWVIGELSPKVYKDDYEQLKQTAEFLIRCLQDDFTQESVKVWILDALSKISSVPNFDLHSKVKSVLENHIRSANILVYQRSIQCKKLAKYNAALRQSYNVNFEEDLPFLQEFVQKAKDNGARLYDPSVVTSQTRTTDQLRFKPYESKSYSATNNSNGFPFAIQNKPNKQKEPEVPFPAPAPPRVKEPIVEKKKKNLITPEERAKKNLAQSLFGQPSKGTNKPSTKADPKAPDSKKKIQTSSTNAELI